MQHSTLAILNDTNTKKQDKKSKYEELGGLNKVEDR